MVMSPQSLNTRTPGHYIDTLSQCIGIYFPGAGLGTHRNIDSASVVWCWQPKFNLDHPRSALSMGLDVTAPFLLPGQSQVPILQLGMLEQRG